jgi:hypothetical protein
MTKLLSISTKNKNKVQPGQPELKTRLKVVNQKR